MGFQDFCQIYDSHNKIYIGSARLADFKVKLSVFVKSLNCQMGAEI